MKNGPLRIAIDARYLSHGLVGGVHSYLRNLSLALLAADSNQDYVFWIDDKATFELASLRPSPEIRHVPWHTRLSSISNDLRVGKAMFRDGADVAHFPANYGLAPSRLPAVITIHDAINLLPLSDIVKGHSRRPQALAMMTYLHVMTRRAVRQQPFVVTVSQYSRDEILKHVDLDPGRVFVVPSAHEAAFRPVHRAGVELIRARHRLRGRVILADAIKNPDCVLRAYRALPIEVRDETSLVFFSRRAVPNAVQSSLDAGESTVFLRPDQSQLVDLYNLADVFVFPSWYEGFGLPVLEAMACGTPVIASSRGSLPEVAGSAGIIADAEDHDAIAAAITQLFRDGQTYARKKAEGLERAAEFSWERSASQIQEIYAEVHERSRVEYRRHNPHVSTA